LDVGRISVWTDWDRSEIPIPSLRNKCEIVALDYAGFPGEFDSDGIIVDLPEPPEQLLNETSSFRFKVLFGCSDERIEWADTLINVAEPELSAMARHKFNGLMLDGPRYSVLRPEFAQGRRVEYDYDGYILVVLGGTDSAGITLDIVGRILSSSATSTRNILVILPNKSAAISELLRLSERYPRIIHVPASDDIHTIIEKASLVITAPGNLLFECLSLTTPVIAFCQNDRQLRDFHFYPWLYDKHRISHISFIVDTFLKLHLNDWFDYCKDCECGQGFVELVTHLRDGT